MIVFVLRHADRVPDKDKDVLKPEGIVRANLLARMLAESGIRIAYCSAALRAQATLRPLKEVLGDKLKVDIVPLDADHEQHIIAAVKALSADATAMVIGHSDTVVTIIKGLTDQPVGKIAEHEFDKLFVLSIPAAGARTVALLRYGEPT